MHYIQRHLPERPYYFIIKLLLWQIEQQSRQGFIQQLSPRKKSKKGNEYYTFQLQTSPTSSQKVVSYQGDQYSFFKEMYSDKSPVKITSFQKDDHLQFSDRCRVTKLKGFDVPFDYAEVDACCSSSLSEEKPKVLKVNELKDIVSGTIVNNDCIFENG